MSLRNKLKQFATHPAARRSAWIAGAALFVALCSPAPAHAQFDTAAILAYLEQLNSMMQSSLGVPLSSISSTVASMNSFTQSSVYPQDQLQQAQQMATGLQTQASSGALTIHTQRSSSQNPTNQAFETALLSGNPNATSAIPAYYTATYGASSTTNIPPQIQTIVDMNDALAQDAMKRSIQMDAVSDRELDLVQQLLGQASSASSGTAPILTVQADAWLVQANAYSQLAEADLLRVKAGQLATTSAMYKLGASMQSTTSGAFTGILGSKSSQ
jgi:hypothetical protein